MTRNLPTEILFQLLDEIKYTDYRLALLRVCRSWNIALRAKVYSSIKLSNKHIIPLAESLQRHPRLKPLVQELHCPYFNIYHYQDQDDGSGLYDRALFHEFLQCFTDTDNELVAWEKKLDQIDGFSWLAVLLVLLPNLQLLDLERMTWKGTVTETTLWAVSRIASRSPQAGLPLQKLQKVSARVTDSQQSLFSIKQFIPFLTLPSMQALHLDGCYDIDRSEDTGYSFEIPLEIRPRTSPIRELSLPDSNCQTGLCELMPVFAQLERFEYLHTNLLDQSEDANYRCHKFRDALLSQKRSLRELRLNDVGVTKFLGIQEEYSGNYDEDIQESKEQAWFGSLVEFTALKELRMPVSNILDSVDGAEPSISLDKLLPQALEILALTKVDFTEYWMLEGQLRRLLAKHEQFPSLRKILLQTFQLEIVNCDLTRWEYYNRKEYTLEVPERAKTVFADVASSFREQGIDFDLIEYGDHQIVADGKVMYDADEFWSEASHLDYWDKMSDDLDMDLH